MLPILLCASCYTEPIGLSRAPLFTCLNSLLDSLKPLPGQDSLFSNSIISPHGARAHKRSSTLVCCINCTNLKNSFPCPKEKCWGRQKCPLKSHNLTAALEEVMKETAQCTILIQRERWRLWRNQHPNTWVILKELWAFEVSCAGTPWE